MLEWNRTVAKQDTDRTNIDSRRTHQLSEVKKFYQARYFFQISSENVQRIHHITCSVAEIKRSILK
jgi:hypothetical protein